MTTFTLPAVSITANVERDSPGVTPGANFHTATVTLTDPFGDWPATPDPTRHVVKWGFQVSVDGGTTWAWGPVFQEEPGGLPFGSRNRVGGMPAVSLQSSDLLGTGTTQLRLAILTDAPIRLGATVVTA